MLACPASPPSVLPYATRNRDSLALDMSAAGNLPVPEMHVRGNEQQVAADSFLADTFASTSTHGAQSFFDALRRTSTTSRVPSVGSGNADSPEDGPPGILNTIADQGSTAWMGMPDDVTFGPTSQRHRTKDRKSRKGGASRTTGLPAHQRLAESELGSSPDGSTGLGYHEHLAELRSELHDMDDGDCGRQRSVSNCMNACLEADESWIDHAIEKTGTTPLELSADFDNSGDLNELSFWAKMEEEGECSAGPDHFVGVDCSEQCADNSQMSVARDSARPVLQPDGLPSKSVDGLTTLEQGEGVVAVFPSAAKLITEEVDLQPWRALNCINISRVDSEASSDDSSVDLDAVHSYRNTPWPPLEMAMSGAIVPQELDFDDSSPGPMGIRGVCATGAALGSHMDWISQPSTAPSKRSQRHHRSHTCDLDSGWDNYSRTSEALYGMNSSLQESSSQFVMQNYATGGHLAGNSASSTIDPHATFWAQQLRMSALALSPRAADAVSLSNPSVVDMGPSASNGLKLNAMLAAVATGGSREDVLAAADLNRVGARHVPASPNVAGEKPAAELRHEAYLLLKVLRNNPAESPTKLRQLIALAERPTGAEAIAKEGGLDVVVMVMSSDWANRMIATMCAELLRALLPGGVAMARRKLLKRLPQLEEGALSGVDGVLLGDNGSWKTCSSSDPTPQDSAQRHCTSLKKKHVKKLRKRSSAIAWACHALVRVMQHFQNEEAVQDKGSSALWGVLSPPNEPQSTSQREIDSYIQRVTAMEVLEAGGVFVLINNLKQHAGHANVAYSAVGALLAIAQLGPQARGAIDRQRGRKAIRSAMLEHSAIGYGGRFASLAGWLEGPDEPEADAESECSLQTEEEDSGEDRPSEPRRRTLTLSIKKYTRRAPPLPPGASALAEPPVELPDLKHTRMQERASFAKLRAKEDKLWNRIMNRMRR